MILAANYARENKVPHLGIFLGMQISVIDFAQSVLCLEKPNSLEFDAQTLDPVVIFMPEVTWIEHNEVDYSYVTTMFRELVSSGFVFRAKRWIATSFFRRDRITEVP
ncbi:uncharacterized protein LOC141670504 [Apium graveolens]|uniref:uncharacterized protein LOC141670504 n=1 Tax=Apium graveolens TaxID=4045 RepID=UPI003D78E912